MIHTTRGIGPVVVRMMRTMSSFQAIVSALHKFLCTCFLQLPHVCIRPGRTGQSRHTSCDSVIRNSLHPTVTWQLTYTHGACMDQDEGSFKCSCGRGFIRQGPLSTHRKTCSGNQKRLAGVLQSTKNILASRKKRRCEALAGSLSIATSAGVDNLRLDGSHPEHGINRTLETTLPVIDADPQNPEDHSVPEVRRACSSKASSHLTIICR